MLFEEIVKLSLLQMNSTTRQTEIDFLIAQKINQYPDEDDYADPKDRQINKMLSIAAKVI